MKQFLRIFAGFLFGFLPLATYAQDSEVVVFYENFENTMAVDTADDIYELPEGWSQYRLDSGIANNSRYDRGDTAWMVQKLPPRFGFGNTDDSSSVLVAASYFTSDTRDQDANRWIVSPEMELSSGTNILSFQVGSNDGNFRDKYEVYYSLTTDTFIVADFEMIEGLTEEQSMPGEDPINVSLNFPSSLSGEDIVLAFRLITPGADGSRLYVDEVKVTEGIPTFTLPYFENFEGTEILDSGNFFFASPQGYQSYKLDTGIANSESFRLGDTAWIAQSIPGSRGFDTVGTNINSESTVMVAASFFTADTIDANRWLTTPGFDIEEGAFRIGYKIASRSESFLDNYSVYYTTVVPGFEIDPSDFTPFPKFANGGVTASNTVTEMSHILPDSLQDQVVYFAFQLNTPAPGGSRIYLDDIFVEEILDTADVIEISRVVSQVGPDFIVGRNFKVEGELVKAGSDDEAFVFEETVVELKLVDGTGTISGMVRDTIPARQNSFSFEGLSYSVVERNVTFRVEEITSGGLTASEVTDGIDFKEDALAGVRVIFEEDFEDTELIDASENIFGIPEGFQQVKLNSNPVNEVNGQYAEYGWITSITDTEGWAGNGNDAVDFETSWRADSDTNKVASATSWHTPEEAPNKWLILPAVTLSEDSLNYLAYQVMSRGSFNYRDHYRVFVTTQEPDASNLDVSAFDEIPLTGFSNPAPSRRIEDVTLPLPKTLNGRTLYFAFQLNTPVDFGEGDPDPAGAGDRLFLDNILVYSERDPDVQVSLDKELSETLTVYPNPVEDKVMIKGLSEDDRVSLFKLTGETIPVNTIGNEVSLSTLKSGIYLLKISRDNASHAIRVVKK
jgi:hypothetical protein